MIWLLYASFHILCANYAFSIVRTKHDYENLLIIRSIDDLDFGVKKSLRDFEHWYLFGLIAGPFALFLATILTLVTQTKVK